MDLEDIETGEQCVVDFSSLFFQSKVNLFLKQGIRQRNKQLIKTQCEQILIDCQKDIYQPLLNFFQKKKKNLIKSYGTKMELSIQ